MASSSSNLTPIRAIHTPLLSRAAPSIPAPSTVYEPLAKNILRVRLVYRVFTYTAVYAWLITSTIAIFRHEGSVGVSALAIPFKLTTILFSFLSWSTTAVPVAVIRKFYLTPTRNPSTSFTAYLTSNMSETSTRRMFALYIASAAISTILDIGLSSTFCHKGPVLSLFVKSRKHPFYLNGKLLFVMLAQGFTAAAYTFRHSVGDRFVFRWEYTRGSNSQAPVNEVVSRTKRPWIPTTSYVTTFGIILVMMPSAALTFGFLRLILPLIYKLPLLHYFLRPFTAHFLRGPWTIALPYYYTSTIIYAGWIACKVLLDWEVANVTFDNIIYQPVIVSQTAPEPQVALVSGCSSSDSIYRYMAANDLLLIASGESTAAREIRKSFFNDQKYNPSLWSYFLRDSLIFLGKDYQHLLRRGKPPPSEPVQVSLPPAAAPSTPFPPPTPLIRTTIFRSSKPLSPIRNVVESLGSDGLIAKALDAGAEAAHVPELFRSVERAVLQTPVKESVKEVEKVENMVTLPARIRAWAKGKAKETATIVLPEASVRLAVQVIGWLYKERADKQAMSYLPHVEVDVMLLDVLSHLICASLTEDKFGVVQRDIPRTLEAMTSFLTAIEEYDAEVRKQFNEPTDQQKQALSPEETVQLDLTRQEIEKAEEVLHVLSDALRSSIGRIAGTFGDKLLAFKFPSRTSQKLQPFLELY